MSSEVKIDPKLIPDYVYDEASRILSKLVPKYLETHKEEYEEWLKTEEGQRAAAMDREYLKRRTDRR